MPVSRTFSFNDGVDIEASIFKIEIDGFDGGSFISTVKGTQSTVGAGGIKDASLNETVTMMDDLDENGTGDLLDALNQAASELSISISGAQFRDLLLRMHQLAVSNKRINSGA